MTEKPPQTEKLHFDALMSHRLGRSFDFSDEHFQEVARSCARDAREDTVPARYKPTGPIAPD